MVKESILLGDIFGKSKIVTSAVGTLIKVSVIDKNKCYLRYCNTSVIWVLIKNLSFFWDKSIDLYELGC